MISPGTPRSHLSGEAARHGAVIEPVSVVTRAMGGRLGVHVDGGEDPAAAARACAMTAARIGRWADRLSRHLAASELSALNASPESGTPVGPTLARALQAGRDASEMSDGLVDITMLDARLAAEFPGGRSGLADQSRVSDPSRPVRPVRTWMLAPGGRRSTRVVRSSGVRFDLDGVAKGWIADRAVALLCAWPSVLVDADGDLALRAAPGKRWRVGIDDPRTPGGLLTVLELSAAAASWPARWGVATSGTSVHRWNGQGGSRHHIIDPRTGFPAVTDVVQATVVCGSALRAEALAKAAVITGSVQGLAFLERAGVAGAVILTERDEVLALPSTLDLLVEPAAAA